MFKKNPSFKGRKLKDMREWRYPKIDLNELKKYGGKGIRYTREDMDMIPVDVASLVKIRKITEVNDIHVDDVETSGILHRLFNNVNQFLF